MERGKIPIRISPAACIMFVLSVILLPLDWVLAWLTALTVHEGAHILSVRLCGGRVNCVCFALTGAQIVADGLTAGKQIICSLAGPFGGLMLFALLKWFPQLAICACAQSICNMIPFWGSDGGRALVGALCLWLPEHKAERVCRIVDRLLRIALCALGFYAAWKLSWGLLATLSFVLLLRRIENKNSLQSERSAGTIELTEINEVRL